MNTSRSKKGLIVSDSISLPGSIISTFLTSNSLSSFDDVTIISLFNVSDVKESLSNASIQPVDVILSLAENPGRHDGLFLTEVAKLLKNGGTLTLQEPVATRPPAEDEISKLGSKLNCLQTQAELERGLLLSGLSQFSPADLIQDIGLAKFFSGITPAYLGSTVGPLLKPFSIRATKPSWHMGASVSLKKKKSHTMDSSISSDPPAISIGSRLLHPSLTNASTFSPSSSYTAVPPPSPATWRIAESDARTAGADYELVDEDELLTGDDVVPPTPPPSSISQGCDSAKSVRKACKNCTCGRAEMEEKIETKRLTLDQISDPQSACGSCGLGDAFRCAGCPYRGLPPFKLGEKISLSASLLSADA